MTTAEQAERSRLLGMLFWQYATEGHSCCEATAPAAPRFVPRPLAGDLAEALAKQIGADRVAKWIASKLGVDCGCSDRRDALNRLHLVARRVLRRAGMRSASPE